MNFEEEDCSICGIPLKEKYTHSLQCNHKFHYECLLKTFTSNSKYEKKDVLIVKLNVIVYQ